MWVFGRLPVRLWLTGLARISCCISRMRFFFSAHTSSAWTYQRHTTTAQHNTPAHTVRAHTTNAWTGQHTQRLLHNLLVLDVLSRLQVP